LEFKTRLISGKVERLDGFGIIHVLLAGKFVEAGQAYNPIPVLVRHNSFPNFVRNVKIKLIVAFTHITFLALEVAKIACSMSSYSHGCVRSAFPIWAENVNSNVRTIAKKIRLFAL
jgi:hypothetical protein